MIFHLLLLWKVNEIQLFLPKNFSVEKYIIIFHNKVLTRKVHLLSIFTSETSKKILGLLFASQNFSIERNFLNKKFEI